MLAEADGVNIPQNTVASIGQLHLAEARAKNGLSGVAPSLAMAHQVRPD